MTPEAQNRLEDLGYKVNPMAAKKAKKKPSAKQLAARRKFAAAAKARSKAAKKRNGKTIVKAKRVTIVQMPKKVNPVSPSAILRQVPAEKREAVKAAIEQAKTGRLAGLKAADGILEGIGYAHNSKISRLVLAIGNQASLKQSRTVNPRRRNGTVIKAKRIEHLDVSKIHSLGAMPNPAKGARAKARKNPALEILREAKPAKRGNQQGWLLGKEFIAKGKGTKKLPGGALFDTNAGFVYRRVENPKKKATARKRNIQFMTGDGYPMRASWDYDPVRAGEGRTGRADYFSRPHVIGGKKISGAKLRQLVEKKQREAVARAEGRLKKARASRDDERIEKAKDHLARTRAKVRAAKTTSGAIKSDKETEKKRTQRRQLAAEKAQRKATTTRLAARSLQRSYPLKGKRNPNDAAKAGYESFQGKTSTKSTSLNFPNGTPANVYKLGSLHSITLADGRTIKPAGKAVWLCADTKGKLHLGTTGERLTNAPKGSLGKVKEVEYITSKPHLGDNKPARYFHQLGEETGEKPTLYSDGNGGLVFKGGAYSITSRGIVN